MSLIACPECSRQISTEAAACPHCGHPNRLKVQQSTSPQCYACSAAATTRCQGCGKFSCAVHLQNIFVSHGRGGANELRCEGCYASARAWKLMSLVFAGILVFIFVILFLSMHH